MAREFAITQAGATVVNAVGSLIFINPAAAPNFNLEFLRFWISQELLRGKLSGREANTLSLTEP